MGQTHKRRGDPREGLGRQTGLVVKDLECHAVELKLYHLEPPRGLTGK